MRRSTVSCILTLLVLVLSSSLRPVRAAVVPDQPTSDAVPAPLRISQTTHEEAHTVRLRNSESVYLLSNATLNITSYEAPEGYNIGSVSIRLVRATAVEQWWGGYHHYQGGTTVLLPAGSVTRRAQSILPGFAVAVQNMSLYLYRSEGGGTSGRFTVGVSQNVVGDKPALTMCSNTTYLIDSLSTGVSAWVDFTIPCQINYTSGAFWVVLNGTELGLDKVGSWLHATDPQPQGNMAYMAGGSWTTDPTRDHVYMVNITRLSPTDNSSWTTTAAEALNLSVAADGGAPQLFGADSAVGLVDVDQSLLVSGNLSAELDLVVTWTLVAEAGEPSEGDVGVEEEGRVRVVGALEWHEPPWEWDLIQDNGWYVLILLVFALFLFIFGLLGIRPALLVTLLLLAGTVVTWYALWQWSLLGGPNLLSAPVSWANSTLRPLIEFRESLERFFQLR